MNKIIVILVIVGLVAGFYFMYQNSTGNDGDNGNGGNGNGGNGGTGAFETNAGNEYGTYVSGTWIKVDTDANGQSEKYIFSSTTTTGSCIGLPLLTTNSGLVMHKYSGSQGVSVIVCNPTSNGGYKKYQLE